MTKDQKRLLKYLPKNIKDIATQLCTEQDEDDWNLIDSLVLEENLEVYITDILERCIPLRVSFLLEKNTIEEIINNALDTIPFRELALDLIDAIHAEKVQHEKDMSSRYSKKHSNKALIIRERKTLLNNLEQ